MYYPFSNGKFCNLSTSVSSNKVVNLFIQQPIICIAAKGLLAVKQTNFLPILLTLTRTAPET